ncbi:MAG: hypothetical protein CR982_06495 [Candidatus Cloacimonadota bacterium]|nr:MAG: hypothetical protein CR982_06495 [Candidatus Cloacimonadota bacterium]PIE79938.1 MAG: hypothetical protein CSA15_02415 [Candidatus Delongbacteria bacterium]
MKKIVAIALTLVMASMAFADFSAGMKVRFRNEMGTVDTGFNSDKQVFNRSADVRFRPNFQYKANKMLSLNYVGEIGDIQYGVKDKGGAVDTDGINFETKNLFLDINPNKNFGFRLGLQPYADPHSLVFDTDVAGAYFKYNRNAFRMGLGWFVPSDNKSETNYNDETWSFGENMFVVDACYAFNKNVKAGLNTIISLSSSDQTEKIMDPNTGNYIIDPGTNYTTKAVRLWISPFFDGTFGKFSAKAQFSIYSAAYENEKLGDNDAPEYGDDDTDTGMAFSLNTHYYANENLDLRFNFMFNSSDSERKEYFMDDNGKGFPAGIDLEILTPGGNGIYTVSPFTYDGNGLILPAFFLDYKFNKNVDLTLGAGIGMTVEDVDYYDTDGTTVKDNTTYLGTELDVKAKIRAYDKLTMVPYFAMLLPGEALTRYSDDKDMQMKFGVALKMSL